MGIERSTFIIDGSGSVTHEWRKVKVANHVEEVLEAIKETLTAILSLSSMATLSSQRKRWP